MNDAKDKDRLSVLEGGCVASLDSAMATTDRLKTSLDQSLAEAAVEVCTETKSVSKADHAAFRDRQFFGSLDALRAISVIAVIWHHVGPVYDDSMPYFLASGFQGVTLFFGISGFLIVTLLLRERERSGQIDLKAFYIRRSLRIFPLYYAVIAIYVISVLMVERNSLVGREFFANLPFFLTYTSNWFVHLEGRVIFYFAWSLAAEEQFYIVWPTIEKYLTSGRVLALMAVVIATVTATQLLTSGVRADNSLPLRIVTGVPLAICFGVMLAHALHYRRSFDSLRCFFANRWSVVAWFGLLLVVLNWRGAPEVLVHASAVMFVGACVYREDHVLARVMRLRGFAHVGAVSYGIYLLHMLVKNAIGKVAGAVHVELSALDMFILTVVGSIIAASLSFRFYEAAFLRTKERYGATRASK